jgi:lipoprotein NlpI
MTAVIIAVLLGSDQSQAQRDAEIIRLSEEIKKAPKSVALYSERGDAYFQSGYFSQAEADYRMMVEIEPKLDPTHWRLGLAYYYTGKFDLSAKQFEKYQTVDDVDRENGLWRFLAMAQTVGKEKARQEMINYKNSDRPPFDDIYKMFQGKLDPDTFSRRVTSATQGGKQRFYADLYLGLYFDVEGQKDRAIQFLKAAEESSWGRSAGDGPGWMWHIARLHRRHIESKKSKSGS